MAANPALEFVRMKLASGRRLREHEYRIALSELLYVPPAQRPAGH